MPTYEVTDPQTGKKVRLTGDTPPTEQELEQIFSNLQPQASIEPQPSSRPTQESSFFDEVIGGAEGALAMGTGLGATALGGIAGTIEALNPFAEQGAGARLSKNIQEELTYQPRTLEGERALSGAAEFIEPVATPYENFKQYQGDDAFEATGGNPFAATVSEVLPDALLEISGLGTAKRFISRKSQLIPSKASQKRKLIVDEIKAGNPNIDNVTKMISESGDIVTNKPAKKVLKALGGDIKAQQTVSVLESMNNATRSAFNEMLDIIKDTRKHPNKRSEIRHSDVLGRAIGDRAKAIYTLNKQASKKIGDIADKTKSLVDISDIGNTFIDDLTKLGVTFNRGKDGWITPDFSRSKFSGGNAQTMGVLINDLTKGKMSFKNAHNLKREIRDNLNYDKLGAGAVKGKSEKLLNDLSANINSKLTAISDPYKLANEKFSKTIKLKNQYEKMAGKDIDLFDDAATSNFANNGMKLVSNYGSRGINGKILSDSEKVLKDLGVNFKNDISSLIYATTDLEDLFKIPQVGSLQGNMQRAGKTLIDKSPTKAVIDKGAEMLLQLSEPDFDKQITMLRNLTKQRVK